MCVNERDGDGRVYMENIEIKKVQEFKYLGSTMDRDGDIHTEVSKRLQSGWKGWRKVSSILCDRNMSTKIKGKVYRTCVRPAIMHGLETIPLTKVAESKMEVAEMRMLRFSLGLTRLNRVPNAEVRKQLQTRRFGDKLRESRLRWFGHVKRRPEDYDNKDRVSSLNVY
ncbi:uncharacterized protein LOC134777067 [Penaeus indicus]|uniref:uncharacterized protein LOC134777067 n=1 Tax=Penaeus indicus TaxID=29960 RepID=UPI00300CD435